MTNVIAGGTISLELTTSEAIPPLNYPLRGVTPTSGEGSKTLPWPVTGGPSQVSTDALPATITVTVAVPATIVNNANRTATIQIPIIGNSGFGAVYTSGAFNVIAGNLTNSPAAPGPAPSCVA